MDTPRARRGPTLSSHGQTSVGPKKIPSPKVTSDWRFGLVTGSDSQGTDVLRGVEKVKRLYGDASEGGLIKHLMYPDNFLADLDTTKAVIESLADDPLVKVIYVLEGVPGTTEAFKRIRERRPDITLLVSETHEDTEFIASVADMVVNADFVARGYLIPLAAKKLGAKTLVHVSFPRHMIDESLSRARAIMELACEDLGLEFAHVNAPDPTGQLGVKGAQDYIFERLPKWLEKYGQDAAFYTTNNAHTAPMIKQIIAHGGYFVEADEASPLLGFPEALGLTITDEMTGDWDMVVREIERGLKRVGADGRLGTWVASLNFSHVTAMVEFGRLVATGKAEKRDLKALLRCYESVDPKIKWNGGLFSDVSLKQLDNVYLIYQDTYIFGLGFLGMTDVEVPLRYKTLRKGEAVNPLKSDYRVGLITGEDDQGADDVLGAKEMIARYGAASTGGLILHEVYPSDYLHNARAMAEMIEKMAEDPLVKVIIVNQAIPGTAEGFRRVKLKRPDIYRLAGEPFESPELVAANADLAVAGDFVARGYLIPYTAKSLGAEYLVHISFPRHLAYDTVALRLRIMEEACKDLGLGFYQEIAPDPVTQIGVAGAQRFIMENYPKWLKKYGPKTAFFSTNDAHTEPLLRQMAFYGGYFIEADIPSTLLGYPGAFNLNLNPFLGQWVYILGVVEDAVSMAGGSGRLGTWVYPLGFTQTTGLVEFARLLVEGRANIADINSLLACLGVYTPGARWNGSFINDQVTGKPLRNYFLIYQDTYIFGKGYIETTKVDIPDKFFTIKLKNK
jgi:hypothetical protein